MTDSSESGGSGRSEKDAPESVGAATRPVLTVTRGNPTAEEIAALTVVLAAVDGGDAAPGGPGRRRGWAHPSRRLSSGVVPLTGWGRG